MSDYERVRETESPEGVRRERDEVIVRRDGLAGWWIAAVVAIVAVVGLLFIFSSQSRQDELQAAREQGVAQARLESATTDAQQAAMQATQSAQSAVDSSARATQRAAEAAQHAADQTAQQAQAAAESATDTARDASTTEPAPSRP
jgi:FtsZ-interacting cell division protein ZipA